MKKTWGYRQVGSLPSTYIDSIVHTDFAVGLGQLGLSWMYDIIIIIIIIILL